MTEECTICEAKTDDYVSISRCCCWSDYVCRNCVTSKSLAEYVAKAAYDPAPAGGAS